MAGQVGFASEPVWAGLTSPAVPDKFVEVLAANASADQGWLRSNGIRAGRRTRNIGKLGAYTASGQLRLELPNVTMATLLKQMFGTVVTTGAGPYTHTATPGPQVGTGKSMVIQTGITDDSDTVQPFTAYGAKVGGWELTCQVGEYAQLSADWTARDISFHRTVADGATTSGSPTVTSATAAFTAGDLFQPISGAGIPANSYIGVVNSATSVGLSSSKTTNTPVNATATATGVTITIGRALAAASYAATLAPFTFLDASVSAGGVVVASAKGVNLRASKGLKTDRHKLGSRYINEQREVDKWEFTGSISAEFESPAMVRHAASAAQLAFVLAFSNGVDSLTVTSNIQVTGDVPSLDSHGLQDQTINFEVGHATTDASAITAVLVNADVAA
ncbi:MAG: hypothetical protein LC798_05575 [Chloroflexi bacterium]|nr:hypothetical protein [Chloroflexota bacterium]